MRYFFYTRPYDDREQTVIIIREPSSQIETFPLRYGYSISKAEWLGYYNGEKAMKSGNIFEICHNQFLKFKEQGITPMNWDY